MFLEAIVVKLKVGGAHSLGLHPERPLRWLSMSQVLRVREAFGFSCCRQWRVTKDNTSIESTKESMASTVCLRQLIRTLAASLPSWFCSINPAQRSYLNQG